MWAQVEKFVAWQARKFYKKFDDPQFALDDLISGGYFAVIKAAEWFEAERGTYLTLLGLTLRTEFAEVAGLRRTVQRNDAEKRAQSLEAPLGGENEDLTLREMLPDPSSAQSIAAVEHSIFTFQLHAALEAALEELPESEGTALRMKYFDRIDYRQQAEIDGCKRQYKAQLGSAGLWHIRLNERRMKELSAFMYPNSDSFDFDIAKLYERGEASG